MDRGDCRTARVTPGLLNRFRTIRMNLVFVNQRASSILHSYMKQLFPPNNRIHTMGPRDHEHFQVDHANTERMKNSPIIYMQNLLNQNIKRKKEQDRMWKN